MFQAKQTLWEPLPPPNPLVEKGELIFVSDPQLLELVHVRRRGRLVQKQLNDISRDQQISVVHNVLQLMTGLGLRLPQYFSEPLGSLMENCLKNSPVA